MKMKRQFIAFAFLLIFSKNCECRFQDSYSKWSMDKDCTEEFCFVGDDCKYDIEPIGKQHNCHGLIFGTI